MHCVTRALLACSLLIVGCGSAGAAEAPVTWDLSEIYSDDDAWTAARDLLSANAGNLDRFKGKLGSSAADLKNALDASFAIRMQLSRLTAYAGMRADEDTRESGPQGMRQATQILAADLTASTAWLEPEILALPEGTVARFLKEEPGMGMYRRYLERLEKRRPHVLDADAERLLGSAQRLRGDGRTIGGLLRNAEIPWSTIRLSDGSELRVDATGYSRGRASANREDRIATFDAFYSQLAAFKGSLAAALSATVQEHVFEAQVRNYGSALESSLAQNEVDPAVYHMLISEIGSALPTLHRYLRLRARILGLDELRYHDIYPPLVEEVAQDYTWDKSRQVVIEALAPLGSDYTAGFSQALENGWVDVFPRPGKRSGAYVNDGAYEVHPYMLLNHQDDYSSASTLAHEGGHLMHSWFSEETQPYPTAGYSIFVAEVASTFNEVFLFRQLLDRAGDDRTRLSILGNFLEAMRGTVFRQTMFAEFELAIHRTVERGEPLTGDGLNAMYLELVRRYHGEARGVMKIDEAYAVEWAYVPHFHYDFYVYQYATSYMAAIALAEGVQLDRPGARERFMVFLRSGSMLPPVELLAKAGVDMTSPEPMRAAMRLMNEVMDQIEKILDK